MSIAKKCDICNKLYEPYVKVKSQNIDAVNGIKLVSFNLESNKYYSVRDYDLCEECMKSFKEYIKNNGSNGI